MRRLLALWLALLALAACAPAARVASLESCDPDDAGELDAGEAVDSAVDAEVEAPPLCLLSVGQSNAAGYGVTAFATLAHPSRADISTSRIAYIGGTEVTTRWTPLTDIGHAYPATAPVHWHPPDIPAAVRLADVYGHRVIVINVSRGGTGFNFWRGIEVGVAGNLFQKTRDLINLERAAHPEMESCLWAITVNLGEQSAKSDTESANYQALLTELVDGLRRHTDEDAPVVIMRLHEQALLHSNLYTQRVIDAQIATCLAEGYTCIDPTPLGDLKGDHAHYMPALGWAVGEKQADVIHVLLSAMSSAAANECPARWVCAA